MTRYDSDSHVMTRYDLIYPQGGSSDTLYDLISPQGGSSDTLYQSVHGRIFSLPDDYTVYPAHDYKG